MKIIITLFTASAICLAQSFFFFPISVSSFAPWIALVILYFQKDQDFGKVLWLSALPGLLVDLLSDRPFGLFPISYTITSALLFRLRTYFLHDALLPFSFFTMIVSFILAILELFFFFLFDRRTAFLSDWRYLNLLYTPIVDGLYAFFLFSLPWYIVEKTAHLKHWLSIKMRRSIE